MRLADYVCSFLEECGVNHVFMLSGGGIMYLMDSLGRSSIEYVCCHHEQAAGIAAQAYSMHGNKLGVCMVTTGPGGTNALTAAGAAYVDSTPVLFITGQVKTSDFASLREVRQFGAQENDIISMAKPITKYAVTVTSADEIRFHMEKAVYLALHGRRGPVWIDIPLDIQSEEVDLEELAGFHIEDCDEKDILAGVCPDKDGVKAAVKKVTESLKTCKRPLILIGHGLVAAGATEIFQDILHRVKIPVVSTWRALGVLDYEDNYFFGSPGLQANRYSNIITQGADFLLVLGSRLDNMITAFNEEHFAFRAQKVIVDIDEPEIDKLQMKNVTKMVCDVKFFLQQLVLQLEKESLPDYLEWLDFCSMIKSRFPLLNEKQAVETEMVDLYQFTMKLSDFCRGEDVIVVSSTSRCNTAGHMAFKHKINQKIISSMGFGAMGFALPSVIGAWFAAEGGRVVMIEGDGSLQLNIQEIQTIVHNKINAKMFIFHNSGYAAITTMQDRNFDGFYVGSNSASGVTMPDLKKIAAAYGIPYCAVKNNKEIEDGIAEAMNSAGAYICEFFSSITFDEIPKCISNVDENGKRVSAVLENPYPYLDWKELETIYQGF